MDLEKHPQQPAAPAPPAPAGIRASDADRDRIADILREAMTEGRLTAEEHAERVDSVYRAKTVGELEPLVQDLPTPGGATRPSSATPYAYGPEAPAGPADNLVAIFSSSTRKGRWRVGGRTNAFALFTTNPLLRTTYEAPELRLVFATAVMLTTALVAVLAAARFAAEGRRFDLVLASGFFAGALSTALFTIAPVLDGDPIGRTEAWAGVGGRLIATALVAAAPFVHGRAIRRDRALGNAILSVTAWVLLVWVGARGGWMDRGR